MRSAADASPSHLYVPGLTGGGEAIELGDEESRYLARVCRARPGEVATATDGAGAECRVRVATLGRRVTVTVESVRRVPRPCEAWLLCGAPEGLRADWLVEKLGELGVSALVPIDTERGAWALGPDRRERLGRLAVAALRQSRRAWLLEVRRATALEEALASIPEHAVLRLARSGAPAVPRPTVAPDLEVGAIGPAGGFSRAEEALIIGRGFVPIRLSDARLRTETAAIAYAADWSARAATRAA